MDSVRRGAAAESGWTETRGAAKLLVEVLRVGDARFGANRFRGQDGRLKKLLREFDSSLEDVTAHGHPKMAAEKPSKMVGAEARIEGQRGRAELFAESLV